MTQFNEVQWLPLTCLFHFINSEMKSHRYDPKKWTGYTSYDDSGLGTGGILRIIVSSIVILFITGKYNRFKTKLNNSNIVEILVFNCNSFCHFL